MRGRFALLVLAAVFAAACSGSGPARWADQSGVPVPRDVIDEGPGPSHCGWESATFLRFEDGIYVRDPSGVLAVGQLAGDYEPNVELPRDAQWAGFSRGEREIWTSGSDPDAVYMVFGDHVERWPALRAGCA